jgi:branched-chain amino acid transport system permease protein
MSAFLQYVVNGLTSGAFIALVALGYTMIYGVIRLINFAHGDVLMVGSFIGYEVVVTLVAQHWPVALVVLLALLAGMVFTGGLGMAIERVAYHPLLNSSRLAILISALGVSLALQQAAQLIFGAGFSAYLSLLLMLGLWLFVTRTMAGTAMRALAMDKDAATLMGINVPRTILLTFMLGSVLAGASGVMQGMYYTEINFFMGFLIGLRAFTAAVLGGIGNIPGAMVAGLIIGLIGSFSDGYISSAWSDAIIFAVLIAVLVFKPTGLFGERVAERV